MVSQPEPGKSQQHRRRTISWMYLELFLERWHGLFIPPRLVIGEAEVVIDALLLWIQFRGQDELLRCGPKILSFGTQQADVIVSRSNHSGVIDFARFYFLACFLVQPFCVAG